MKFEKFLKQTGTHGTVIEINESEKWLVCDGVGMVIPRGVDNILGTPTNNEYHKRRTWKLRIASAID